MFGRVAIDHNGYALAGTAGGGVFRSVQSTAATPVRSRGNIGRIIPALAGWIVWFSAAKSYDKSELKKIIGGDGRNGDASLVLAGQLIAAKLNLANGSDPAPVSGTIDDADALLSGFSGKLPYSGEAIVATWRGDGHRCGCPA